MFSPISWGNFYEECWECLSQHFGKRLSDGVLGSSRKSRIAGKIFLGALRAPQCFVKKPNLFEIRLFEKIRRASRAENKGGLPRCGKIRNENLKMAPAEKQYPRWPWRGG